MAAPAAHANGVPLSNGDVLAATGTGQVKSFSPSGTLLDTLDTTTGSNETTGMCFDAATNLYVTDFSANEMSKFDSGGNLLQASFGSGFNTNPESCTFNAANDMYVGQADGSTQVLKFDTSGNLLASYSPAVDARGTDWVDLSSDQCTLYYTSEGTLVKRFNVCTNTQLADFASGLPAPCFELRIRPNGEVLVACQSEVLRLSPTGSVVQTYPITGSSLLFAMNLDPDGTSFWTGDLGNGEVSHVDIATGNIMTQFNSSPATDLAGLAIVGGIVVSQPTLTLAPPTATQNVGSPDTVTATITNPGGSISGQTVHFSVTGANTTSGTGTTNSSGQATFTYTGLNAGNDTVTGSFTNSQNVTATGTAMVTWVSTGTQPTTLTTSLSGGGQSGATITVPSGTSVTDKATLSGANVGSAGGTVTYNAYSNSTCTVAVPLGSSTVTVTGGSVPASSPVTFTAAGTYYWTASYSGDSTNGASSSTCGSETATVTPVGTGPTVDGIASAKHPTSATAKLKTTNADDLLVAFVAASAPKSGGQMTTVTGDGLTWTDLGRDNARAGDSEIWTARATGALSKANITVTGKFKGAEVAITVVAFSNATGTGAVTTADSGKGAPTATLTTTQANSWVWASGDDWLNSISRTPGSGQKVVHSATDAAGDTFWVQSTKATTAAAGTPVTINDTAPKTDPYNLVLVEIL